MKDFSIEDYEDEFIGWFASLPVQFVQAMYQLWELNQLPDIQEVITGLHTGRFRVEPIRPPATRNPLPDKRKPITNQEIIDFENYLKNS